MFSREKKIVDMNIGRGATGMPLVKKSTEKEKKNWGEKKPALKNAQKGENVTETLKKAAVWQNAPLQGKGGENRRSLSRGR